VRVWSCRDLPDVGAIDAISDIDSTTVHMPRHTIKLIHIAPAVPPFAKLKTLVMRENSQVKARMMT